MKRLLVAVLLLGWVCASTALAAALKTRADLLLANETARPGETVWAGVRLRMAPGWHTYWRFAGDSGAPTKIEWKLPSGVTAGEIHWPVPEKLTVAGFTTYVFHDETVLLVPLQLADDAPPGRLPVAAEVSWLECEQICVPGRASIAASLTVGAESKPSPQAAVLAAWQKRLPRQATALRAQASWEAAGTDESRFVVLEFTGTGAVDEWDFFPYTGGAVEIGAATERSATGERFRLRKQVKRFDGQWPRVLAGLLVHRANPTEPPMGYEVNLPLASVGDGLPATSASADTGSASPASAHARPLLLMLVFAFVGGLILNVMPCVLPVIALKILSFVTQSQESPARVRALGLVYGAGVLVSFLVLAGLAISVISAGRLASWGMVLQDQTARVLLTILITLVALNLFGVFEVTLGGRAAGAATALAARPGYAGAFFNGVLATILATPCTAPFLGAALAFAFTQPAAVTVLVFGFVGLGLAAPFVVLCWQPAWLKLLPKPGPWMKRFKVAMGFPMLATAVWLFWFTAPRFGKHGVLWLGLFLVVVALAAWIWGEFVQRGGRRRGLAMALAAFFLGVGYVYLLESKLHWRTSAAGSAAAGTIQPTPDGIAWQVWSPEAVAAARAAGHPVLVDFTADNCLNCQVNKATSLEIKETREKLRQINAVAFLADFTDNDPRIARVLQQYQRAGVPLVLVYPKDPNAPPIVLPPILTPKIVLEALDKAAG